MQTQSVLIGEIVLGNEPRIKLYAETPVALSREGVAVLKDKLANILDSRFRASDPIEPSPFMTIREVAAKYHCLCLTVARLMRAGQLHPMMVKDEPWFHREEVARVMERRH